MPAEVALRLDISFVDTAPGCTKEQVGNVSRFEALPLSDFGSGFVFLRAADQCRSNRSELLQNLLFEHGTNVRRSREVSLASREPALAAHVDEIGEWLGSGGSLVEVRPLPTERIRRDHTLGLELVVAHGTTKLYLTQRCHGHSSYPLSDCSEIEKEYLCHGFEIPAEEIGLVESLGRLYLLASQKRDWLPTPRPGR